jgi:hypothetical protein
MVAGGWLNLGHYPSFVLYSLCAGEKPVIATPLKRQSVAVFAEVRQSPYLRDVCEVVVDAQSEPACCGHIVSADAD